MHKKKIIKSLTHSGQSNSHLVGSVSPISNSVFINAMGVHERQHNSHQEQRNQTGFLALPQELICQQICRFPGAAQEDLLYSFCCCLLITQAQQSAGISILRGALGLCASISRALQNLPQPLGGEKHPHLTLAGFLQHSRLQSSHLPLPCQSSCAVNRFCFLLW